MKQLLAWLLALTAIVCYVIFWQKEIAPPDSGDFFANVDMAGTIAVPLIFSVFTSVLLSLIPFGNRSFASKFKLMYPLNVPLVCLLLGCLARPYVSEYDTTIVHPSTNCAAIRNGKFTCEEMVIYRHDSVQTETLGNNVTHFKVRWLNTCEYELVSAEYSKKVKVVTVDQDGYTCLVLRDGRSDGIIYVRWADVAD